MKSKLELVVKGFSVILLLVFIFKGNIPYEKFESKKWKEWINSNSESDWSLRWDMMNSLRNNYKLKGMSKTEIIKLLGEPTSINEYRFDYGLGYSHNGINTGRLTIIFGEDDKVIKYLVSDG